MFENLFNEHPQLKFYKKSAKKLFKDLKENTENKKTLMQCQEIIARNNGYNNWHHLYHTIKNICLGHFKNSSIIKSTIKPDNNSFYLGKDNIGNSCYIKSKHLTKHVLHIGNSLFVKNHFINEALLNNNKILYIYSENNIIENNNNFKKIDLDIINDSILLENNDDFKKIILEIANHLIKIDDKLLYDYVYDFINLSINLYFLLSTNKNNMIDKKDLLIKCFNPENIILTDIYNDNNHLSEEIKNQLNDYYKNIYTDEYHKLHEILTPLKNFISNITINNESISITNKIIDYNTCIKVNSLLSKKILKLLINNIINKIMHSYDNNNIIERFFFYDNLNDDILQDINFSLCRAFNIKIFYSNNFINNENINEIVTANCITHLYSNISHKIANEIMEKRGLLNKNINSDFYQNYHLDKLKNEEYIMYFENILLKISLE